MINTTNAIKELTLVCKSIQGKATALSFFYGENVEKMIELTDKYTEIFPNVQMKAVFGHDGSKKFIVKAKAGSKIDVHRVLPQRFIYVAYGEHKEPVTGKIYKEGDEYHVEANVLYGANFTQDSRLIIETEKE